MVGTIMLFVALFISVIALLGSLVRATAFFYKERDYFIVAIFVSTFAIILCIVSGIVFLQFGI